MFCSLMLFSSGSAEIYTEYHSVKITKSTGPSPYIDYNNPPFFCSVIRSINSLFTHSIILLYSKVDESFSLSIYFGDVVCVDLNNLNNTFTTMP